MRSRCSGKLEPRQPEALRILLCILIAVALTPPIWAQEYRYDEKYMAAAQAVLARRYVDARTLGERLLVEDPTSFEAHAVLAQVHLMGEGNLARADYHNTLARELLEKNFPPPLSEGAPIALHREILRTARQVAFEREDYLKALAEIDAYNTLYEPHVNQLKGWPLLKLGRYEEAQELVQNLRVDLDEYDSRQADLLDILGQIAYEQSRLEPARDFFEQAALLELDTSEDPDPAFFTNLGEARRDLLDFDGAIAAFTEAGAQSKSSTYAQPDLRLAALLAGQGRFEDAFSHLEAAQERRGDLFGNTLVQTRAAYLTGIAEVFLALGDSERALRALEEAFLSPHRYAWLSGQTEMALGKRYLLYACALDLESQKEREKATWTNDFLAWSSHRRSAELSLRAAWARAQVATYAARGNAVSALLKPYGPNALEAPWLLPRMREVLGAGPLATALKTLGEDPKMKGYTSYIPLLKPSATALREPLPSSESLAGAELDLQDSRWGEALRKDPSISRRRKVAIPLIVEGPSQVERCLLSSPRFEAGEGTRLLVGNDFSATLNDAGGQLLARIGPSGGPEDLSRALHQTLFERALEWNPARLDALIGEPDPGRAAGSRLEGLLNQER